MIPTTQYPHIAVDATGVARIGATRYKVLHLAGEHYHGGWSAEQLLQQHPDLRPEEVYAALTYFYDHYDEMVAQLNELADHPPSGAGVGGPSREALMQRQRDRERP